MYVLILLATVTVLMNLLSNTFRYLGAWTVENMRTRVLCKKPCVTCAMSWV